MKLWVLIIMVWGSKFGSSGTGVPAIHSIEFKSQKACIRALMRIKHNGEGNNATYYDCISLQ